MLQYVGYKKIDIKNNQVTISMPQVVIDLNAIAQGYTSDLIGQFFDSYEITSYLIDVGGELLSKEFKPDKTPWVVGIEKPTEASSGERKVIS